MKICLIGEYFERTPDRVWMVSYDAGGNIISNFLVYVNIVVTEYSRRIMDEEGVDYIPDHQVYTKVSDNGTCMVYDNNAFFYDKIEIPVAIHSNGVFEVYPEEDYDDGSQFGDGWMSEGLYGKYPLNEDWTIVDLEGKKAENVKTRQHYSDELNGVVTLFNKKVGGYNNVGVKGPVSPNDISFPILDSLALPDNKIERLIESAQSKMDYYEYGGRRDFTISASYQLLSSEKAYYIVVCTLDYSTDSYEDTKDILLGVFDDKVYQLTSTCFYLGYDGLNIFKVNNDVYLYAYSTSCGEGAALSRHIYQLKNGFQEVFQLFTSHD